MKTSTVAARLMAARDATQRKKILNEDRPSADAGLARALKEECYRVWTSAPAEARRAAAALRSLAALSPEKEIEAMRFWVEGIADITAGKLESSVDNLDAASRLLRELKLDHESAQPQVAKLIALAMLGRYDEAQSTGRRALRIFEKFDDQLAAGKIEMNLSNIVSRRDQYRLAEQYCLSAYRRFESLGERTWQTMAENGLANTYAELNDFDRAEEFYASALKRARSARMNATVAEIEASLGNLDLFRGRYAEALRWLERSRQMYQKLEMPHQMAIADLEIADIYAELNMGAEALEMYPPLISQLHKLKMRAEEARARANHGRTLAATGDTRRARAELKRAANLFRAEENPIAAAAVDLGLASLEASGGNFDKALAIADSASGVLNAGDNVRLRIAATWLRGEILCGLGKHTRAETFLRQALEHAKAAEQPAICQAAMNSLGKLAQRTGKSAEAERMFKAAIKSAEAARDPLPAEEFRMAFLAKSLEPYQNLTRLLIDGGRIEDALVVVERARSRSLVEAIAAGRGNSPETERGMREELNWYYSRLDRSDDPDEASKFQKEIRKREKRLASATLHAHSLTGVRNPTNKYAEIDLDELHARLGDDRVLIEYVSDGGVYSAFVVADGIVNYVASLATDAEVMSLLEGLRFQFGSLRFGSELLKQFGPQLKARADLYLEKLYDKLLRPLEGLIGDRHLIVVPAGSLNYVPFSALHNGESYTVEARDITCSPSASAWLLLGSRPATKFSSALLMAFADQSIPLVDREVNELSHLLPNSQKLAGRRATFEAFRSQAGQHDLIHLACHAQFRPDNPMFSSLHLSDGWVTVRDVCSSRINAGLVTLSACETGLSKVFSGEEILGLARGFLSAGARSLVLSLWMVNDEATVRLMGEFYSNLQRGLSVSASLRVAQKHFIDRGEHPYFWSPFFAIE